MQRIAFQYQQYPLLFKFPVSLPDNQNKNRKYSNKNDQNGQNDPFFHQRQVLHNMGNEN